jgi:hypothetical protein
MKKGMWILSLVALVGFLFVVVGALTAADVPDQVTIENKGYKSDKKGPVKFAHKKHATQYKVACTECHHDAKDGKQVQWKEGQQVKKCITCHDPEKVQGETKKLSVAYHTNCRDECHKKNYADKAPSKNCKDCHQGG